MILIFTIGILAGFLTLFINYCIGKPSSKEFSPYEIFSGYTVWLSKRRLKQIGLYDEYSQQYHDNLKRLETCHGAISLKNDFRKVFYDAAEPFFTWERMVGMCPVCTGFWVSLLTAVLFCIIYIGSFHILKIVVTCAIIILTSHVTIRLLNKII